MVLVNILVIIIIVLTVYVDCHCFQGNFNITNGFTDSDISYTISYTDVTTGNICGSATILQSSCVTDVCIHIFDILSSTCMYSVPINVTVSATNIFGTGPPSHPIQIYG